MTEPYDPRVTPWLIDDSKFYELESFDEQIRFLLRYAILAPSSHNAQPWVFRPADDGVEVRADYSRRLAVVDPADRELLLSVGAAIANLRIAAAHFGFDSTVLYTRNGESPEIVAFVALRRTSAPDPDLRALFPAIKQRHTNREPFEREPVNPEVLEPVCDVVERYPETLHLIVPHDKDRVADLVALADERKMAKPVYRQELAGWVRSSGAKEKDGMAADGLGLPPAFSSAADWVLGHIDAGPLQAKRDRNLVDSAVALIVVAAGDDVPSLAAAGEIMERLLLTLTRQGLHYSFFNGPIELEDLRRRLWTLVGCEHPPQLLLRVGQARAGPRPMPRRPVEDVVT